VHEVVENRYLKFDQKMLEHFKLPYANTCHSVQGLSINGPLTIFDVNTPYVDRFYIWTAITRSTDLSQVTIFQHSENEIQLKDSKKKQYVKNKITEYKYQGENGRTMILSQQIG